MPLRFVAKDDVKAGGAVVIAKGAAVMGAVELTIKKLRWPKLFSAATGEPTRPARG